MEQDLGHAYLPPTILDDHECLPSTRLRRSCVPPPPPPSFTEQGLGHAYLPAAILVLAGSLARPASAPQPVATEGAEVLAAPVYQPETRVAFYKKVGRRTLDILFAVRSRDL